MRAAAETSGIDRLALPAAILLGCAAVAAVTCVPYLPTHDGPQHVYTVHAAANLDDPALGYGRWFAPNAPISNHGFTAVFAPLDAWLPWQTALRVALGVMAALWVAGAYAFARALHPARGWLGVALGAAALQWCLYMGFFSFYVASAVGLLVLSVAFGLTSRERPRLGVLAALLFLEALLHVMAAAVTGLALAALLWLRDGRSAPLRTLARIAGLAAPAAGVLLATIAVRYLANVEVAVHADDGVQSVTAPLWTLGKCFLGGPAWRAWPLTALALAAPALALTRIAGPARPEDRALCGVGALLLLVGALAPLHLPSWDFFSVRFLPLGVCAAVASIPLERVARPRARAAIAAALTGFALAATGWAAEFDRTLAAESRDALAGLSVKKVERGARLPVVLDPTLGRPAGHPAGDPMPYMLPLINLGKLYATAQGGYVPYTFDSDPSIHSVVVRKELRGRLPGSAPPRYALELEDPARAGDLAFREAVTDYLAAWGTRYQEVIFYGRPVDVDHLLWLGFRPEWRRNGLALARFEGCPLTLRFPVTPERAAARVLELGWYPALGTTHRYTLSRSSPDPDGSWVLPLRQTCAAVWIAFEGRTLRCAGAGADGRLVVRSVRDQPELTCRVERASARLQARAGER